MKTVLLLLLTGIVLSASAYADNHTSVRGYKTKSGTVVQPHERSNKNKTQIDNWSTKGNSNPHSGKRGSKKLQR
jgi:hypothetical protein